MLYGLMVKKQEARSRMAAVRKARRRPQAAAEQRIRLTGYVQPEAKVNRQLRFGSIWCQICPVTRADVRLVVGKPKAREMNHATSARTGD